MTASRVQLPAKSVCRILVALENKAADRAIDITSAAFRIQLDDKWNFAPIRDLALWQTLSDVTEATSKRQRKHKPAPPLHLCPITDDASFTAAYSWTPTLALQLNPLQPGRVVSEPASIDDEFPMPVVAFEDHLASVGKAGQVKTGCIGKSIGCRLANQDYIRSIEM